MALNWDHEGPARRFTPQIIGQLANQDANFHAQQAANQAAAAAERARADAEFARTPAAAVLREQGRHVPGGQAPSVLESLNRPVEKKPFQQPPGSGATGKIGRR